MQKLLQKQLQIQQQKLPTKLQASTTVKKFSQVQEVENITSTQTEIKRISKNNTIIQFKKAAQTILCSFFYSIT